MPAIAELAPVGHGFAARRARCARARRARGRLRRRAWSRAAPRGRSSPSSSWPSAPSRRASSTPASTAAAATGPPSGARRSTRACRTRCRRSPPRCRRSRRSPSTATATRRCTISTPSSSTRSRATGSALAACGSANRLRAGRPTALELFLDGLTAAEPELPRHPGYAALERRLTRWVDDGLGRRSAAPGASALHLDERPAPDDERRARARARALAAGGGRPDARPARLAAVGGRRGRLRLPARPRPAPRPDPPARRRSSRCSPSTASSFDADQPTRGACSSRTPCGRSCARRCRELEERGVPVLLPAAWMRSPSRLRVNLAATSRPPSRSSGLLSTAAARDASTGGSRSATSS